MGGWLFASCAPRATDQVEKRLGPAVPTRFDQQHPAVTADGISAAPPFRGDVLPLLERRCVVCHGRYDAPCQLKLGSWEGVTRGASQTKVYDGERLLEAPTTRLFEDAERPSKWRTKSFFPVLNEWRSDAETNRVGSLLYRMLALKRRHPLAQNGVLPGRFDFGVERQQVCPNLAQMTGFEAQHPDWGMPFGLPGLEPAEESLVVRWLERGAGDAIGRAFGVAAG